MQRTALGVLRRLARAAPADLAPAWRELVPSVCSVVQGSAGPTKLAAERTLARVLGLEAGLEKAQVGVE